MLEKRLDKLGDMIQSFQVTVIRAGRETPPPKSANVACVTKQPQRQSSTSRSSGEALGKTPRSSQNRRQFVRPFDANINEPRQTQTEIDRSPRGSGFPPGKGNLKQNLVRAGVSGGSNPAFPGNPTRSLLGL